MLRLTGDWLTRRRKERTYPETLLVSGVKRVFEFSQQGNVVRGDLVCPFFPLK